MWSPIKQYGSRVPKSKSHEDDPKWQGRLLFKCNKVVDDFDGDSDELEKVVRVWEKVGVRRGGRMAFMCASLGCDQ